MLINPQNCRFLHLPSFPLRPLVRIAPWTRRRTCRSAWRRLDRRSVKHLVRQSAHTVWCTAGRYEEEEGGNNGNTLCRQIVLFLSDLNFFCLSEIYPRRQTLLQGYGGNAEIGTAFYFKNFTLFKNLDANSVLFFFNRRRNACLCKISSMFFPLLSDYWELWIQSLLLELHACFVLFWHGLRLAPIELSHLIPFQ